MSAFDILQVVQSFWLFTPHHENINIKKFREGNNVQNSQKSDTLHTKEGIMFFKVKISYCMHSIHTSVLSEMISVNW